MIAQQFKIKPVRLEDGRLADGVLVNEDGAWLGEVTISAKGYDWVQVYSDEGGDYIEAPEGWHDDPQTIGMDITK